MDRSPGRRWSAVLVFAALAGCARPRPPEPTPPSTPPIAEALPSTVASGEWNADSFARARREQRLVLVIFASRARPGEVAAAVAFTAALGAREVGSRLLFISADGDEIPELADFARVSATVLAQRSERPSALLLDADAVPRGVLMEPLADATVVDAAEALVRGAAAGAIRLADAPSLTAVRRAQQPARATGVLTPETAAAQVERLAGAPRPVTTLGSLLLLTEAREVLHSPRAEAAVRRGLDFRRRFDASLPQRLDAVSWQAMLHARLADGPLGPDADAARERLDWAARVLLDEHGSFRAGTLPHDDGEAVTADTRIFTAGNGAMIEALALAGVRLQRPADIERAVRCAEALLTRVGPPASLRRGVDGARGLGPARLDDYAAVGLGLLRLYEATSDRRWLTIAESVADAAVEALWDTANGGFFLHAAPIEPMPVRIKSGYDDERPSDNALLALLLDGLARHTGRTQHRELARRCVEAFAGDLLQAPSGVDGLMAAVLHVVPPSVAATPTPAPQPGAPARLERGGIHMEARLDRPILRRGERAQLQVDLRFTAGWRVTPHRPAERGGVALSVTLLDPEMGAGAASYPVAGASGISAVVPLRIPGDAELGPRRARVAVRFEACHDKGSCEPPERVTLEVPLTVVR